MKAKKARSRFAHKSVWSQSSIQVDRNSAPVRPFASIRTFYSQEQIDDLAHDFARRIQREASQRHVYEANQWIDELVAKWVIPESEQTWLPAIPRPYAHDCEHDMSEPQSLEYEDSPTTESEEELLLSSLDQLRTVVRQVLQEELSPLEQLAESFESIMTRIIQVSQALTSSRERHGQAE